MNHLFTEVALLILCSFLNLRGFVADYNMAHCREASGNETVVSLDVKYLFELGIPALPALERAQKVYGIHVTMHQFNQLRDELDSQFDAWKQWTLKKYWIRRSMSPRASD